MDSKKKRSSRTQMSYRKKQTGRMVINETSAAALPLTRFRGLARVPDIRIRVPSSTGMSGVAHPCPNLFDHIDWKSKKRSTCPQMSCFPPKISVESKK